MRSLGNWCTTHRRTVILGWIVALLAIGFLAGSVGTSFSNNFELPSSDSERALTLLEKRFPARSGAEEQVVFRAAGSVRAPAVRRRMQRSFAEIGRVPEVSGVSSPYRHGDNAAISPDGRIAYATVTFDDQTNKLEKANIEKTIDLAHARLDRILPAAKRQCFSTTRSRRCGLAQCVLRPQAALVTLLALRQRVQT